MVTGGGTVMKVLKPSKTTAISSNRQLKEELGKAVEEAMKKRELKLSAQIANTNSNINP